jgi:ribose transport system permease protein
MVPERLVKLRYRFFPDHLVGEILSKRWIDNVPALIFLAVVVVVFGSLIPNFFLVSNLVDTSRQLGEIGLVVLAMTLTVLSGGIDLSVGSNFGLANIVALILIDLWQWPFYAVVLATLVVSGLIGLLNGILVGYLRLRAFLTTLVTLIIVRAIVDILLLKYAQPISASMSDSDVWDFMGEGTIFSLPFSLVVYLLVALLLHFVLSRTRPGWRILAVGGSRRSAHNVGIPVRRVICGVYVLSGVLCGLGGVFYAARSNSPGSEVGTGLEVIAITAAVLGGNSLGGGRGSVVKAIIGAVTVLIVTNGVIRIGLHSGGGSMVLGAILLIAVFTDIRWLKHRNKLLSKVYVSPTYFSLPPCPTTAKGSGSPYAVNNRLNDVELIGLGTIEWPEDVIFDKDDNLYCGSRQGDIVRFLAPEYKRQEVFAHIGGFPAGLACDKDDNIFVCVAGMGLYKVSQDRSVHKVTDETNRSWGSIVDDSRLRIADDLDIAPDGRIFFSEATVRYETHDWPVDALESRGNGRIVCYDPATGRTRTMLRNLVFPNGVVTAHDGQSILFCESWGCRINRFWISGPKTGQLERVLENLPGYPDNINRASDGGYWIAILGMRSPTLDLALRRPGFRRRMARRLPNDQWLYPNINHGFVIKMTEAGEVVDALWDETGENHPMITSMREHKGSLFVSGITNNRIGRHRLPKADPNWTSRKSYWEQECLVGLPDLSSDLPAPAMQP